MRIMEERLPDRFLIIPNPEYFFGEIGNQEDCLDIVESFFFKDIAEVYLARLGALGLKFNETG
ncbi:MAG: hypothetical protein ACTSQ7_13245, partial [Alphaproteobacteria bacterium]